MARSMKTRGLDLPEALPACLYPPGYMPPASVDDTVLPGGGGPERAAARGESGAVSEGDHGKRATKGKKKKTTQPSKKREKETKASNDAGGGKNVADSASHSAPTAKMHGMTSTGSSSAAASKIEREEENQNQAAFSMSNELKARYDKIFDNLAGGEAAYIGNEEVIFLNDVIWHCRVASTLRMLVDHVNEIRCEAC